VLSCAAPTRYAPKLCRIRTRAHQRSRLGRMRRLVVIPAASALAVGGATAGALALMGEGHASDSLSVRCVLPSADEFDITGANAVKDDPVELCRDLWNYPDFEPGPDQLTACAPRDGQGVVRVYEGGPAVCEEHGEVPYAGPDDEQRRLALLRTEVAKYLDTPRCQPRHELEATLQELLDEYQLAGWTVANADSGGEYVWEPFWSGCGSVAYDEQHKKILLGDPLPELPEFPELSEL
jgi:hypothetical protein